MDWLSQNSVWVLICIAFVGLHLFGHSPGGHCGGRQPDGRHARTKRIRLPWGTERRERTDRNLLYRWWGGDVRPTA